uniref:Uncharacterized protein n=1 Tax=Anguilla anguilla TaxID=7936 RepID=A0A0E9WCJ6_ANGAN
MCLHDTLLPPRTFKPPGGVPRFLLKCHTTV